MKWFCLFFLFLFISGTSGHFVFGANSDDFTFSLDGEFSQRWSISPLVDLFDSPLGKDLLELDEVKEISKFLTERKRLADLRNTHRYYSEILDEQNPSARDRAAALSKVSLWPKQKVALFVENGQWILVKDYYDNDQVAHLIVARLGRVAERVARNYGPLAPGVPRNWLKVRALLYQERKYLAIKTANPSADTLEFIEDSVPGTQRVKRLRSSARHPALDLSSVVAKTEGTTSGVSTEFFAPGRTGLFNRAEVLRELGNTKTLGNDDAVENPRQKALEELEQTHRQALDRMSAARAKYEEAIASIATCDQSLVENAKEEVLAATRALLDSRYQKALAEARLRIVQ
jgi:hypothetical protein